MFFDHVVNEEINHPDKASLQQTQKNLYNEIQSAEGNKLDKKVAEKIKQKIFSITRTLYKIEDLSSYEILIERQDDWWIYTGVHISGKKYGYGLLYHKNFHLFYEGEFIDNNINGNDIIIYFDNGNVEFEGNMVKNSREGFGTEYYWNSNIKYQGEFKNNGYHGDNVKIYLGEGSLEFEGRYCEGKRQGYGKWYHLNQSLYYAGEFRNNYIYCNDELAKTYHSNDMLMFQAYFRDNGLKYGHGKAWYKNGKIKYQGNWDYDCPYNDLVIVYSSDGIIKFCQPCKEYRMLWDF